MLKQSIAAITATILLSAGLSAQERPNRAPNSLVSPFESISTEGGGFYSEDFETFTVGPLVPQGGWDSDFGANATVVDPGLGGSTRAALHTSDGSVFAGFEMRSPTFGPEFGYIEVRQVLTGSESLYQIVPVDTGTSTFNTRVTFEIDGSITVGQLNATGDGLDFLPSTGSWTVGEETVVGIEVNDAGELFVYQDGSEIFAGTEVNFDLSGTPGQIGEIYSFSDNAGGTDNTQVWDDILFVDAPPVGPGPGPLPETQAVPVNNFWALGLMALLIAGLGTVVIRRMF